MKPLRKVLRKLVKPFYRAIDLNLVVISLDKVNDSVSNEEKRFQFRLFRKEDLPSIERIFVQIVASRFAQRMNNMQAYLVLEQKHIIGYFWSSHRLVKNEGWKPFLFDILPKKGFIYWADAFIVPGKRNMGAMTALMAWVLRHHRFEQKNGSGMRVFLLFDKKNVYTKKAALKLGFQIEGQIKYRRYLLRVVKDLSALSKVCELN